MDVLETSSYILLYAFVLAAVVSDFIRMKISNRLIAAGFMVSLFFRILQSGWSGFVPFLWNITFPVVVLFLFYLLGMIGAGDIKLFSLIGGFINFTELAECIAASFVLGAVWSLAKLVYDGNFRERLYAGGVYLFSLFLGGDKKYEWKKGKQGNLIHFSLAILAGLIFVTMVPRL